MAITLAQTVIDGTTVSGSTCAGTFGSNTTTGNTIVVACLAGASVTVTSIATSTGAATFSKVVAQTFGSSPIEYWAAANITGGTLPKITVTFSASPGAADVILYEFSGMPSTLTTTGTATGNSGQVGATPTTPAITTTSASAVVFAGFQVANTVTAGQAGWTAKLAAITGGASEYQIFTTTQSALTANCTQTSGLYGSAICALAGASGPTIRNATVSIAGHATGSSFTGNILILKNGDVNIVGDAAITGTVTFVRNKTISITGVATCTLLVRDVRDSTVSISGKATLAPWGVLRRAGTVNISGSASLSLSGTFAGNARITIIGRATSGSFTSRLLYNETSAITPRATLFLIPSVVHSATVSVAAASDMDPPAGVAITPTNATVRIIGLAAGIPISPITARAALRPFSTLAPGAELVVNAMASTTLAANVLKNSKVSVLGRATTSRFAAAVTAPTSVFGREIISSRASLVLRPQVVHNAQVGIRAGNLLAQTRNGQISIQGGASLSISLQLIHNSSVSITGLAALAPSARVTGQVIVNAQSSIFGHAALTLSPNLIHSATVSIAGRSRQFFSALDLANINGKVMVASRATLHFDPRLIQSATFSALGRMSGVFLFSLRQPNQVMGAVSITGRSNLRPNAPATPVLGSLSLRARASLGLTSSVIFVNKATASLRGRAVASFFGTTLGGTQINAVVRISGAGRISLAPVSTQNAIFSAFPTAGANVRGSLLLFPTLSIAGFATFTPQTPHQALVWISANNLQYKVWQFNLEQMVRVLGTTFTVTSVGLSFQSVALELSSSDAGWGS